ncbi:Uncharacterized protein Adt_02001 [Abeliophyllum distichum]|uniref:Uncharacterized protein n=1 Tax=Abeliophyllum distichum TaxID=126358 RepID=A0ABD1VWV3_9LAMI
MPQMKMSTKRSRRDRPPSLSCEEEDPQAKRIESCPVLLCKNVDLASFIFDAPSFHLEDLFSAMGWVSILAPHDKVYSSIVKDFYKKMGFSPGTGISCLVRNKRIKITQELICSILHLEDGGIRLYTTKTIPHLKGYDPVEAYRHVTGKHFDNPARLSSNQLTLTCRVLHNIIAHIIVPRKGPSTLPFEGDEEMDEDEDEPPLRPRSNRPPSSTSGFTFTEDHYNLFNGQIDSLTSTAEGLRNSMVSLQDSVAGMTSLLHALYSRLNAMLPSHPPQED